MPRNYTTIIDVEPILPDEPDASKAPEAEAEIEAEAIKAPEAEAEIEAEAIKAPEAEAGAAQIGQIEPTDAANANPTIPDDYVHPDHIDAVDPDPEGLEAIKKLEERRKRQKRSRNIKIGVVCAVVAALIAAWLAAGAMGNSAPQETPAPETVVATQGPLTSSIQATGTLKPNAETAVTSEVPGIVQEVRVTEGQQVKAGDILFVLKNDDLEKSQADAKAAVDKAQSSLNSANTGVEDAWNAYYRAVDEYNDAVIRTGGEGMSEFDHSGYLSAIDSAQASVDAASAALSDAQRAYDRAVEESDKRLVKANAAGTVLDLKAETGAAVGGATGGTSTASGPLAQIADLSSLSVDVEVNEIDIADIAPGQRATITFTALPNVEVAGEVTSVASVASGSGAEGATTTGGGIVTFKVTVHIKQPTEHLKPGMSANVEIMTKDVPDALIIPANALVEEGKSTYVLVVTDEESHETEKRDVVVADRTSNQVAIESGLKEGDVILADPLGTAAGENSASASSASARAL